jgi:hypothetical protein
MPTVVTFPRLGREPAGLVEANLVYGLAQEQSSSPWRFVAPAPSANAIHGTSAQLVQSDRFNAARQTIRTLQPSNATLV